MFVPYQVDVPMERWPFANWGLVAVTTVISFVVCIGDLAGKWRPTPAEIAQIEQRVRQENRRVPADELQFLIEDAVEEAATMPGALRPDRWTFAQLVTCLFVHGDFFHLIGNMLFLFVFGNAVNAKLGHGPFLLAYFLIGAFTSLTWLAFGNGLPLVGASGAIMGLLGLFLVFFPTNNITIYYWWSLADAGEFDVAAFFLIGFYLVCDLLGTYFLHFSGVAYICHVGGAFAGAMLGVALVGLGLYPPGRDEENLLQFFELQPKGRRKKKKRLKRVQVMGEE